MSESLQVFIKVLSWIATVFSCIRLMPQCIKIIKTKSVNDVSLSMYIIWTISAILWITTSALLIPPNWPLIVTNIIAGLTSLVILILKLVSILQNKRIVVEKNLNEDKINLLRKKYVNILLKQQKQEIKNKKEKNI
ncbi:hypothetical protein SGLAD_v1c02160 [Spiroplasma gladiatoris]|uniref:MtN3 and saliva related transmembrane protein n=1 Tax=Spiroplasma gladiatoris TaxID=2143 RepID=A0A4P7AGC7_9MOLU|nr:PQ-loop domain-containing transporter [Spiroplasma gladiatoris]QBQ07415.1 hypothetical protein SGLAD_v1c02160 [Spiroplasma gladiatoris]